MPVRNEEAVLPLTLLELKRTIRDLPVTCFAGINGCTDRSQEILESMGVACAKANSIGYGHGCLAAIKLAKTHGKFAGYIFFAADGADPPRGILKLIERHHAGAELVLGQRLWGSCHGMANLFLGSWVGLLTGRFFSDLGPFRLIDSRLFDCMALREMTWGWTIEAQIRAVLAGARIDTFPIAERPRLAGASKIRRVSWRHSARIGWAILLAGWRARWRAL